MSATNPPGEQSEGYLVWALELVGRGAGFLLQRVSSMLGWRDSASPATSVPNIASAGGFSFYALPPCIPGRSHAAFPPASRVAHAVPHHQGIIGTWGGCLPHAGSLMWPPSAPFLVHVRAGPTPTAVHAEAEKVEQHEKPSLGKTVVNAVHSMVDKLGQDAGEGLGTIAATPQLTAADAPKHMAAPPQHEPATRPTH